MKAFAKPPGQRFTGTRRRELGKDKEMKIELFALAACLLASSAAFADELTTQEGAARTIPDAMQAPSATPDAASVSDPALPLGAHVQLEIVDTISSATATVGQEVALRLAEPIAVGGQVIVPAGIPGVGVILDVQENGIAGRPGLITAAARYLHLDGERIGLEGMIVGSAGQNRAVLSSIGVGLVGIAGVFVRGQEFEVEAGTRVTARIAGGPPEVAAALDGINPVPAPAPGKAIVVFYHLGRMGTEFYTYGVAENGVLLAELKGNRYVAVAVDPGMHEFQFLIPFTSEPQPDTLHQEIFEGEMLFIRHDNDFLTPGTEADFLRRRLRNASGGGE